MQWSDFLIAVTAEIDIPDQTFNSLILQAITYAENRLQRELDLINTYVTSTGTLTANSRNFTLPTSSGTYVVVTQAAPIISGVRQSPLTPVSRDFLDAAYPMEQALGTPSIPLYWCWNNGAQIIVGPAPDSAYTLEVVGTQRFVPLSAAAPSNFLTTSLPDAYLAAALIFLTGATGALPTASPPPAAPDKRSPAYWEKQYQTIIGPAGVEEYRKKFQSQGWGARLPSPIATPAQN